MANQDTSAQCDLSDYSLALPSVQHGKSSSCMQQAFQRARVTQRYSVVVCGSSDWLTELCLGWAGKLADGVALALLPFILLLNCINVSKITLNTNNFLIVHFHVSICCSWPRILYDYKWQRGKVKTSLREFMKSNVIRILKEWQLLQFIPLTYLVQELNRKDTVVHFRCSFKHRTIPRRESMNFLTNHVHKLKSSTKNLPAEIEIYGFLFFSWLPWRKVKSWWERTLQWKGNNFLVYNT